MQGRKIVPFQVKCKTQLIEALRLTFQSLGSVQVQNKVYQQDIRVVQLQDNPIIDQISNVTQVENLPIKKELQVKAVKNQFKKQNDVKLVQGKKTKNQQNKTLKESLITAKNYKAKHPNQRRQKSVENIRNRSDRTPNQTQSKFPLGQSQNQEKQASEESINKVDQRQQIMQKIKSSDEQEEAQRQTLPEPILPCYTSQQLAFQANQPNIQLDNEFLASVQQFEEYQACVEPTILCKNMEIFELTIEQIFSRDYIEI